MNAYLDIAQNVLASSQQPMTAKQILKRAKELGIVPSHLFGRTQYKTMQARLSEDILLRRWKSRFMRTEPGKFVLRTKSDDVSTITTEFAEFPAPRRADQLKQFNVLCWRRSPLEDGWCLRGQVLTHQFLKHQRAEYKKLADIWESSEISFAKLFVVLVRDNRVAAFGGARRDSSSAKKEDLRSIGLCGFIKEDDANLFSSDEFGIADAVRRTVMEQFHMILPHNKFEQLTTVGIRGIVKTAISGDDNSLVVVASMECREDFDVLRLVRSLNDSAWMYVTDRRNDMSEFEVVSQRVLESGLLNSLDQDEEKNCNWPAASSVDVWLG